jgi:zinc transporter 1
MGLSKTNRIIILLVIDSAFFLLELITGEYRLPQIRIEPVPPLCLVSDNVRLLGYAVHSLALVADSFHMV